MKRQPSPDEASLPWVLRQGSMRVVSISSDDNGKAVITFRTVTRDSSVRSLTVTMHSLSPVEWIYGYVIREAGGTTKKYRGRYGDPRLDSEVQ